MLSLGYRKYPLRLPVANKVNDVRFANSEAVTDFLVIGIVNVTDHIEFLQ